MMGAFVVRLKLPYGQKVFARSTVARFRLCGVISGDMAVGFSAMRDWR